MANQNHKSEKCPEHGKIGKFIPPSRIDKRRKKLIVDFQCPEGHTFRKEFDLKTN